MVVCLCKNNDNSQVCGANSSCEVNGFCYSAQQIITKLNQTFEIKKSAGCLFNNESGVLHCKTKSLELNYTCCRDRDYCNELAYSIQPVLKMTNDDDGEEANMWTILLLIISIVLVVVATSLVLVSIYQRRKQTNVRHDRFNCCSMNCNHLQNSLLIDENAELPDENRLKTKKLSFKNKIFAFSKAGSRLDLKTDIAHHPFNRVNSKFYDELKFQNLLKQGKYSNKYLAKRHGMDVFVKMYRRGARNHWFNEINIYKIILIRHENILNFIAKSEFYDTQSNELSYLTLTEYHSFGSLENYLQNNKPNLNEQAILRLMLTASSGLNHLHLEISNDQRKPSIVHRNINTRNFIVKPNLTCALANFDYAIKSTELDTLADAMNHSCCRTIDLNSNSAYRMITCRPVVYCPPEYLNNTINLRSIVALKSADVYSFSLVLWQLSNYFYTDEYRMPYGYDESDDSQLSSYNFMNRLKYLLLERRRTVFDYSADDSNPDSMHTVVDGALDRADMNNSFYRAGTENKSTDVELALRSTGFAGNQIMTNKINDDSSEQKVIQFSTINNFIQQPNLRPTATERQLHRIISEASYIEPFARLSIRKIEADLNQLLINCQKK